MFARRKYKEEFYYYYIFRDLTFKRGDTIILKRRIDNNWYYGECNGLQGVFPLSYVQVFDR